MRIANTRKKPAPPDSVQVMLMPSNGYPNKGLVELWDELTDLYQFKLNAQNRAHWEQELGRELTARESKECWFHSWHDAESLALEEVLRRHTEGQLGADEDGKPIRVRPREESTLPT